MMLAGHALVLGRLGQHIADHAAQRLLDQNVVADVVDRHEELKCSANAMLTRQPPNGIASGSAVHNIGVWSGKKKVEASVARCLRTPPDGA